MFAVIIKILSIIGILLLVILGIILVLLLLTLFFPVFYKIYGKKKSQEFFVKVRADWLLGLVRAECIYPDPGNITAKVLFFKVFDSSADKTENAPGQNPAARKNTADRERSGPDTENENTPHQDYSVSDNGQQTVSGTETDQAAAEDRGEERASGKNIFSGFSSKYKKLEYTLQKIYDRIKEICENIDFYKKLLEEESTKALLQHAFSRLRRVMKSIRPRKLSADIIFGAATPDITGYVYGLYAMFSPSLGQKFYLTPDFTRQILEGELSASGHITVFTILFNTLKLLFDKKLKILRKKLKKHSLGKNKEEKHREDSDRNRQ